MVKKKPDKFERMVNEAFTEGCMAGEAKVFLMRDDVIALLRQYHQEVVELVEQEQACIDSPYGHGRYDMRDDILTKLKELSK